MRVFVTILKIVSFLVSKIEEFNMFFLLVTQAEYSDI